MQHQYKINLKWTGNTGSGTSAYDAYSRDHTISAEGHTEVLGSSDSIFRGDASKYNPEQTFLASISACHMLWYLHFCADNGVVVLEYSDEPKGMLSLEKNGSGSFTEVTLYPRIRVKEASMIEKAKKLHENANEYCFIANSLNFPVNHRPTVFVEE
jgi:organic hydroperoxide reductase OsmC/OhrA